MRRAVRAQRCDDGGIRPREKVVELGRQGQTGHLVSRLLRLASLRPVAAEALVVLCAAGRRCRIERSLSQHRVRLADELLLARAAADELGETVEPLAEVAEVALDVVEDAEVDQRQPLGCAPRDLVERRVPGLDVDVGGGVGGITIGDGVMRTPAASPARRIPSRR